MKRILTVGVIALAQLGLVGVGVAPQLSARLTGGTYLMRIAPLDPIDPFRGAYSALDYPDLRQPAQADDPDESFGMGYLDDDDRGDIYIPLQRQGEVWVGGDWTRDRPDKGPYLACDDRSWNVHCGIESFFQPQDDAAETDVLLRDGGIAEVKIDGRGNAAVVDVRAP